MTTTIENIEKELKTGNLNSFYILYGEELYLLENTERKIKSLFGETIKGINFISINETNISELIADMETPAFGYEKKLIIVRNSGLLKKEGRKKNTELEKLRENINNYITENYDILKNSIILVIIEDDVDTKYALYKTIEKLGIVCKFDYLKSAQIEKRIASICNAYQVKIDLGTIRYFMEACGTNMQDIINEVRKLIEYAGKGGEITKDSIDKLTIKKIESVIFDLTDNLGNKETKKALQVLNNLIYNKEPLQRILVMLYNHFKKLYFTKIALKYNKDIITSLDLKPNQTFLVNKYKKQASYFKENELYVILQKLRDLDYNYKNGLIDLQIGLEAILCRYCSKNV